MNLKSLARNALAGLLLLVAAGAALYAVVGVGAAFLLASYDD